MLGQVQEAHFNKFIWLNSKPVKIYSVVKSVKLLLVLSIFKLYTPGDKNISILHLSCRTSDLQFSLVLQTHVLVL